MSDLEERLLSAVHDEEADVERLAHEVAASEDAQAYLVELVETLSVLKPSNRAADRAAALLEHGIAIAAEHDLIAEAKAEASAQTTAGARDKDDRRR